MTTIAYRDGIVAADSQETWDTEGGGVSKHKCVKLFRKQVRSEIEGEPPHDVIIATAGATFSGMVFVDWYGSGKEIPDSLVHGTEDEGDFDALILTPKGLFIANRYCRPVKIEDKFIAVGSGRTAAIAAMLCGKTAVEAVQIAMKIDPYTGGKIFSMSLKTKEPLD